MACIGHSAGFLAIAAEKFRLVFNRDMKSIAMLFLSLLSASFLAENPYAVESAIYKVVVPVGNSNYLGTGVLLSPDKILTNCHIVQGKGGWPKVMQRKTGDWFRVTKYYQLGKLDACILVGGFAGRPVALSAKIRLEGRNLFGSWGIIQSYCETKAGTGYEPDQIKKASR